MAETKVQLSQAELDFVGDTSMILTKNKIMGKVIEMMEALKEILSAKAFPPELQFLGTIPAKISRGEQYLGLPYVILDFPRLSKDEDIFFIRNMFWWGHFFSSTLHVSGRYMQLYGERLPGAFEKIKEKGFSLGINPNAWVHHFEADNYVSLEKLDKESFLMLSGKSQFLKLAKKLPIHNWNQSLSFMEGNWDFLSGLISQPVK